jgi:hypothetical protein
MFLIVGAIAKFASTRKILTAFPPLIWTRGSSPAPLMVMLFAIVIVDASVMVCPAREGANWMVSPFDASETAWRNEPGPLSFVFVTVRVEAWTDSTGLPPSIPIVNTKSNKTWNDNKVLFFVVIIFSPGGFLPFRSTSVPPANFLEQG